MKNIFILIAFQLFVFNNSFAQKNNSNNGIPTPGDCKCNNLEVYPYFYYQDVNIPNESNLLLRFDFNHKGQKCLPKFLNAITIYRSPTQTINISLDRLTTLTNTMQGHIFVIPQILLPENMRPMVVGGNYKITYSLEYGTKSVCPANTTKIVRFKKQEPLL